VFELTGSVTTAKDVKDQIINCMASAKDINGDDILTQCETVGNGMCSDVVFTEISSYQFSMTVTEDAGKEIAVQQSIDTCFAMSDAQALAPTGSPTQKSDDNNEVLWIILASIGGVSILLGFVLYFIQYFRSSNNVSTARKFESIRLVSDKTKDPEQGQWVNNKPLSFNTLKYNRT